MSFRMERDTFRAGVLFPVEDPVQETEYAIQEIPHRHDGDFFILLTEVIYPPDRSSFLNKEIASKRFVLPTGSPDVTGLQVK